MQVLAENCGFASTPPTPAKKPSRNIIAEPESTHEHPIGQHTAWRDAQNHRNGNQSRSTHPDFSGLFEAQAARTPDAPAVVFGDTQLSYRELNARANQLARELVRLGTEADSLAASVLSAPLRWLWPCWPR